MGCLSLFAFASQSQTQVGVAETNTWFTVLNEVRFTDKWGVSLETHERLGGFFNTQGQFLLRPSVDFRPTESAILSVGYTFIRVSPYAPYSLPIPKIENNVWEQVLLKYTVGKLQFQNRFRQEHRWSQHVVGSDASAVINGVDYSNRLRFRWTVKRDLYEFKSGHKLFFQAFDEIWVSQDSRLLPDNFARNWLYAGLGYAFNSHFNAQLGYMHQWDRISATHFISSPIVQTTLVYNFDLRKKSE